jgi:hypothetical protein
MSTTEGVDAALAKVTTPCQTATRRPPTHRGAQIRKCQPRRLGRVNLTTRSLLLTTSTPCSLAGRGAPSAF